MSKLIKVLMLSIVLVLTLTLAACGDKITDELNEDKTTLVLSDNLSSIVDNISLPMEGKNGGKITWSSSNTDVVTIEEVKVDDVVTGYLGKVTRPAIGAGDVTLKLTATIKLDGGKLTKVFDIRVRELPVPVGGNVEGVLALSKGTQVTLNDVVVFAIIDDGYYVYDSTGFMFVYGTPSDAVIIGDKANLMGTYDIFYTQPEVKDATGYTVVSSNNTLPTPTITTIAAINAYSKDNKEIYSTYVTVEGTVELRTSGQDTKAYLVDGDDNEIAINANSNDESIKDFEGKKIQVSLILHTYHSTSEEWRMSFVGETSDITELTLTDQEKLDNAEESLSLRKETASKLTLVPTIGDVAVTWTSNNAAIDATTGEIVRPTTGGDTVVELTAKLTIGDLTVDKVITVTVKEDKVYTLKTVIDTYEKGDLVDVEGIVYGVIEQGYFLFDGTGYIYVFTNDAPTVEVGDQIKVTGEYTIYKNQTEIQYVTNTVELTNGTYVLPTATEVLITDVDKYDAENKDVYANYLTIKGKVVKVVEGTYTNWYIEDLNGKKVMVYYKSALSEVETFEGKIVSANVVLYKYSSGWQVAFISGDAISEITYTEQEKLDTAVAGMELPVNVTNTLTVPVDKFGVAVSWVSSNTDVMTINATTGVATIVQASAGNKAVTLEATFTIGSLTVTETYSVIVKGIAEATTPTDLFFSEYIEGSGNNKAFEIYNGTGSAIDLSTYTVEVYSNGETTVKYTITLTGTLADGDVYIIYNSGAVEAITSVGDIVSSVTYYNGDDAIVLKNDGNVIDSIGRVGEDPGSVWSNADGSVATGELTLVRKPTVISGDMIIDDVYDPGVEWIAYPQNTFEHLGAHTIAEPQTAPTDLFFSEYIEGSGNNKAFEIYNGTGSAIDLSTYTVEVYSNGETTVKYTITLTGTLADGDVYIIYNSSAVEAITSIGDIDSNVTYYNGDDAIVLKNDSNVIDSIGRVGEDPGSVWSNADGSVATGELTLVRKSTVISGDIVIDDAFDPSVEWIAYAQDTFTYLGSHTID